MKAPACIFTDFETHGIELRPAYPPKPVSLKLRWPGESKTRTYAWGHEAGGNTCTEKQARTAWREARESRFPMGFQNGMFDLDVAETFWDFPLPDYDRWEDTMFLIFLDNPHAPTLALKPSAERLLGMKPEEQDRLHAWIIANVPEAKRKPSTAGAYIWKAPYKVVEPYHEGDIGRTRGIFNLLWPRIQEAGMLDAYHRELRLMPILLQNSRVGMELDAERLGKDAPRFEGGLHAVDAWLRKRLKMQASANLDSDAQLAEALYNINAVSEWTRTEKGQLSVSKVNLTKDRFKDVRIWQALTYRAQMSTSVNTFCLPWLDLASKSKSGTTLHPDWFQVRSSRPGTEDSNGARSGRPIMTKPNLLNIPKKWKKSVIAGYKHPDFIKNLPELPFMRSYCLPDPGTLWGRRDFNQQELRLFAHFEDGPVMENFLTVKDYDIHEEVRDAEERALIAAALRTEFDRDSAKGTVFGRLYGQGIAGLMKLLRLREDERAVAVIIQKALNGAIPSIKELDDALKALAKRGEPIRTWGGRLYYCEPPAYSKKYKRDMDFAYKLLNYLLQGSGADVTKETLIRWHAHPKKKYSRLIVSVYDEIDFAAAAKAMKQEQTVLKEVMRSIETDVPMLSDGEVGENWGTLKAFQV